jgi:ABC-type bacteriocin/lantibiotic exporter with double-glycine peptidase domain
MMRSRLVFAVLALVAATMPAQAPTAFWIDVPFVPQPREGCGAAALAMVMQYWDAQAAHVNSAAAVPPDHDVATIQRALYSPRDHGITASAMQNYLEQHGFRAFPLNGTWTDLEQHLRKGRPLIVAIRPDGQRELHYVVIDGLDSARGLVMMNDPGERKLLTEERTAFEKDWKATHNWMLLAVPAAVR